MYNVVQDETGGVRTTASTRAMRQVPSSEGAATDLQDPSEVVRPQLSAAALHQSMATTLPHRSASAQAAVALDEVSRATLDRVGNVPLLELTADVEAGRPTSRSPGADAMRDLFEMKRRYSCIAPNEREIIRILNGIKIGPNKVNMAKDLGFDVAIDFLRNGLGASDDVLKEFMSVNYWSGTYNPIPSDIANSVTFGAAPTIGYFEGVKWNLTVAGTSSLLAAGFQGYVQTPFVSAASVLRKQGTLVWANDKNYINDEAYLPAQVNKVAELAGEYLAKSAEFNALLKREIPDEQLDAAGDQLPDLIRDRFSPEDQMRLRDLRTDLKRIEGESRTAFSAFWMTMDQIDVQAVGNKHQIGPRALRSFLSSFPGMFTGRAAGVPGLEEGHGLSPGVALGLQVLLLAAVTIWHHDAAGRDEIDKQHRQINIGLVHDESLLTPAGRERVRNGLPLVEGQGHVDLAGIMRDHVSKPADDTFAKMRAFVDGRLAEGGKFPALKADLDAGVESDLLIDDPDLQKIALAAARHPLLQMFQPGSEVAADVKKKRAKGEAGPQIRQKYGQQAAIPTGTAFLNPLQRSVATGLGGAENVSLAIVAPLACFVLIANLINASLQHMPIYYKNFERAQPPERRSGTRQLLRGVGTTALVVKNHAPMKRAERKVVDAQRRTAPSWADRIDAALGLPADRDAPAPSRPT